jgi:membrane protein
MLAHLIKPFKAYWNAGRRLAFDYGLPLASAMTYSGILALFPFLIFVTALAGFLGGTELADQAVQALFDRLPHEVADGLAPEVRRVLGERRGDFLTFGILLTFIFSCSGVESLRTALNNAYRQTEDRPLWWRWPQDSLFVVASAGAVLLVGAGIVLTPFVQEVAVEWVPALAAHVRLFGQLRVAIGVLALACLLLAMHFWLPAGKRRLADVWPGVAHTMLLWLVAGVAYSAYLSRSTYYATTYAGLANIMIALVFFYLMAVIFVFGAELNRAFMEERDKRLAKRAAASERGPTAKPAPEAK